MYIKYLWSLNQFIVIAWNRFTSHPCQMPHCFYHIYHRNNGVPLPGRIIASGNYLSGHKRTDTIMNTYQPLPPDKCQTILYRVKTSFAPIGNIMRQYKMICLTQMLPISLLSQWKHQYYMYRRIVGIKGLNSTHQHRFAAYRQKLFRNISTHTQTFTTGYYDNMFLHSAIIIACFSSFTLSAPTYFSAIANEKSIAAPGPFPVIKLPSFCTKAAV